MFVVVVGKFGLLVPFFEVANVIEPLPGMEVFSPVGVVRVGINQMGIVSVVDLSSSAA